ncbi:MAG: AAA family ATPase [Archangium sp.]|nr:AAA family ATPase [Archangium sp.]MDP3158156.1 AAA family ATPase [Archangium sp.]MDP3571709.1 AAA family ATPase [Archangium sp.]
MPPKHPELLQRLQNHIGELVLGKSEQVKLALTCLVARGHLLLEDVPGVGKTTLAEGLARSFSMSFARVQFTADVLPSDILGAQVFLQAKGQFEFRPGPIFHQVVLADELNRAPPRTQSALLEAMAQGQVSLDSVTHPLPQPFSVIATQNPLDLSGTYPLPDSQLDRFLLRLSLGHLSAEVETQLLMSRRADPLAGFKPIADAADLAALQDAADAVQVSKDIAEYAVRIAAATREHAEIERGISTRAALSLMAAARALALWEGRDFVTPGDVKVVAVPALSHRLLLKNSSQGVFARDEAAHLVSELLRKVPAPR